MDDWKYGRGCGSDGYWGLSAIQLSVDVGTC